jgi:hypothetical protein
LTILLGKGFDDRNSGEATIHFPAINGVLDHLSNPLDSLSGHLISGREVLNDFLCESDGGSQWREEEVEKEPGSHLSSILSKKILSSASRVSGISNGGFTDCVAGVRRMFEEEAAAGGVWRTTIFPT